jgi:hypothetical protein
MPPAAHFNFVGCAFDAFVVLIAIAGLLIRLQIACFPRGVVLSFPWMP